MLKRTGARAKHYWRRVVDYIRYDFKEIAFPSSLPDPPHLKMVKPRKLTVQERVKVVKVAFKLYIQSWKTRDIDIEDIEYELKGQQRKGSKEEKKEREPTALEDLAVAAKLGTDNIRPALQKIYMIRATSYRDALTNFIQGYQEGLREVLDTNSKYTESSSEQLQDLKDSSSKQKPPKSPN